MTEKFSQGLVESLVGQIVEGSISEQGLIAQREQNASQARLALVLDADEVDWEDVIRLSNNVQLYDKMLKLKRTWTTEELKTAINMPELSDPESDRSDAVKRKIRELFGGGGTRRKSKRKSKKRKSKRKSKKHKSRKRKSRKRN